MLFQMISSSGTEELDEVMSECDSEDGNFMLAYAALELINDNYDWRSNKARTVIVMPGNVWVEIQLADREKCYESLKLRRSVFHPLHKTLVAHYGLQSTRELCSKEALTMFLWTVGAPQSNRTVKNMFSHSTETVSRKFNEVLDSITLLVADIIKPKDPQFRIVHPRLDEARFWPHFKDCIGAIDESHIPVTVPLSEQPKYISRHGYPSQNIMDVCDFNMRFTFVVTGWPGSAHDTRILNDSLLTYAQKFPHPPPGNYLYVFCPLYYL
jgi:hypothetical protein